MRKESVINENWYFTDSSDNFGDATFTEWQKINLPHTWNAKDGADEKGGYKRTECMYAKEIFFPGTEETSEY